MPRLYAQTRLSVEPVILMSQAIDMEQRWRCPSRIADASVPADGNVTISRWTRDDVKTVEITPQVDNEYHTVGINLKSTRVTFYHCGRPLHDGCVMPGVTQVTCPGDPVRALFYLPCDVLHVYVTQALLAECYESAFNIAPVGDIVISDPSLIRDPVIERLALALANEADLCGAFSRVYSESVGLAIVSRLLAREFNRESNRVGRPPSVAAVGLPAWQAKRAIDYIDAHLTDSIGLADIAQSTGLSRMHFAAQFRAATGLRPHEFVLRRRIERAQSLLLQSRLTSLDIALSTGFRSQAHFTTVFKRLVGETPARWRAIVRDK